MLDEQTSTFESEQIGSFFSFAKAKDEFFSQGRPGLFKLTLQPSQS